MAKYPVAGLSGTIELSFPLRQRIIPTWQTNQRPGVRMGAKRYIQHETGNVRPGADAEMHAQYLHDGAPDDNGNSQQLSYHFTVDGGEAYQMIPVNEVSWHGGDSAGPCNMTGISSELCVENGNANKVKARANAEELAAAVMKPLGIPLALLDMHQKCSGKYCPKYILDDGYFPVFRAKVETRMSGVSPKPIPDFPGLPAWCPAYAFVAAFQWADPAGKVTQRLIQWIADNGRLPRFLEMAEGPTGEFVYFFDALVLFKRGQKAWIEGEDVPS